MKLKEAAKKAGKAFASGVKDMATSAIAPGAAMALKNAKKKKALKSASNEFKSSLRAGISGGVREATREASPVNRGRQATGPLPRVNNNSSTDRARAKAFNGRRSQTVDTIKNAAIGAGQKTANAIAKGTAEKDAREEKEVGKKYGGVSPIMSNGVFSSASKYRGPNRLTENDNTQSRLSKEGLKKYKNRKK